jgi:hypothetical protein
MKRKLVILLALVMVVCWLPGQAAADATYQFTSEFTVPNVGLAASGVTDFGTIGINLDETGKIATVTLIAKDIYLIGGDNGFQLTKDSGVTASGFTSPDTTPGVTFPGPTNVDGFGDFNLVIDFGSAAADRFSTAEFTLTATTSWGSASTVLEGNAGGGLSGYDAALHFFNVPNPAYPASSTTQYLTGWAAEPVPLPGAVLLLGAGLVRLAAYARRRREE